MPPKRHSDTDAAKVQRAPPSCAQLARMAALNPQKCKSGHLEDDEDESAPFQGVRAPAAPAASRFAAPASSGARSQLVASLAAKLW